MSFADKESISKCCFINSCETRIDEFKDNNFIYLTNKLEIDELNNDFQELDKIIFGINHDTKKKEQLNLDDITKISDNVYSVDSSGNIITIADLIDKKENVNENKIISLKKIASLLTTSLGFGAGISSLLYLHNPYLAVGTIIGSTILGFIIKKK